MVIAFKKKNKKKKKNKIIIIKKGVLLAKVTAKLFSTYDRNNC